MYEFFYFRPVNHFPQLDIVIFPNSSSFPKMRFVFSLFILLALLPFCSLATEVISSSLPVTELVTSVDESVFTEVSTEVHSESQTSTEYKPQLFSRSAAGLARRKQRFFLPNPCIFDDDRTGAHFDLTQLRKKTDYTGTDGEYFYRMNVCGPVNAGGQCGNALICQYNQKGNHFVAKIAVYDGYFGPRLSLIDSNSPGTGVQFHYMNGDICFIGKDRKQRTPRNTIIQYKCAEETDDKFHIVEDKDTCTFTITLNTPLACWPPGAYASGMSRGTQFLIVFFLFGSLYVIGGFFYNRHYGAEGWEALPNREFWTTTLPSLVKDGCTYSWEKINYFKESKPWEKFFKKASADDSEDPFKGQGAPTARSDDL